MQVCTRHANRLLKPFSVVVLVPARFKMAGMTSAHRTLTHYSSTNPVQSTQVEQGRAPSKCIEYASQVPSGVRWLTATGFASIAERRYTPAWPSHVTSPLSETHKRRPSNLICALTCSDVVFVIMRSSPICNCARNACVSLLRAVPKSEHRRLSLIPNRKSTLRHIPKCRALTLCGAFFLLLTKRTTLLSLSGLSLLAAFCAFLSGSFPALMR
jgi:hypothetical protein